MRRRPERLLVPTQNPVSALQLEGVFSAAEVVDEVAELVDVLQALRHNHLLAEQVRLRQVGAGLGKGRTNDDNENITTNNPKMHILCLTGRLNMARQAATLGNSEPGDDLLISRSARRRMSVELFR